MLRSGLRAWGAAARLQDGGRRAMWSMRKMPQMHEMIDREDPYSYYRGQSETFRNLTQRERVVKVAWIGIPLAGFLGLGVKWYLEEEEKKAREPVEGEALERQTLVNWSGTHKVTTKVLHQPQTLSELEELVAAAHKNRTKLRVTGAGLSPNGISFDRKGMVSLALMDNVLEVDTKRKRVTVQAGARVSQVIEALRPYGLTLQNLASINEQQLGGFVAVSAHGTGATLPPVDNQVVSMRVVTPGAGTITLSRDDENTQRVFDLCKVAMGTQGIVAELTLQCVPAHKLVERTWISTMAELQKKHTSLLRENRHLRYMWVPYTDTVVVVASNPLPPWWSPSRYLVPPTKKALPDDVRLAPMRALLKETIGGVSPLYDVETLSLAQLRDELLKYDPLNTEHIKRVNRAEAACWKMSEGVRVEWSDEVLGFECGGQQWVSEVAFPMGTIDKPSNADLEYTKELLKMIEDNNIPAPAPLEQRWSCASSAPLSPAGSPDPRALFSWLGIIMYLPTDDGTAATTKQRAAITKRFQEYKKTCATELWDKYRCAEHWAKIDVIASGHWLEEIKRRVKNRFPLGEFNVLRARFDPNGVLCSEGLSNILNTAEG
mmetsp:Transcript_57500/g.140995  ORF Transcript_57500/g.140995 Transcript_57500/m.140995 type:complete len:603 (+) Transcript_57500:42-1850(+)